ncbi:hypothetical protein BEN74_11065 [Acinetobacter sp. WCHAc010034]|uniref:hypothetical protein n=1 Tax=Acinetobacter sp. WCHAc010034 TaxID=1879049 RepID=UPI00083B8212|nr:hypothetical protein [Acinetobacter sp. WCHAc010034]AYA03317.1 hypothetical protein BEN74_11065 [Acinetobacter sp. WCHAc010034]
MPKAAASAWHAGKVSRGTELRGARDAQPRLDMQKLTEKLWTEQGLARHFSHARCQRSCCSLGPVHLPDQAILRIQAGSAPAAWAISDHSRRCSAQPARGCQSPAGKPPAAA